MENKDNYIIGIDPYDKPKTLKNKVFEALGEVSMCWSETPKGVFDSTNAERIGNELIKEIEKEKTELIEEIASKWLDKEREEFKDEQDKAFMDYVTFGECKIEVKTELQKAIEVLCNALKEDTSEGSYYYSWQANIAMSFYDEIRRNELGEVTSTIKREYNNVVINGDLHKICNEAAKNFLNLLISKKD